MVKIDLSIQRQKVEISGFSFPRRHLMRFDFFALLCYTRCSTPPDAGWIDIRNIARLPRWRGRSARTIATTVGRYVQQLERAGISCIESRRRWGGPYRLCTDPADIKVDVPLDTVRRYLGLPRRAETIDRQMLYEYTSAFVKGTAMLYAGRLSFPFTVTPRAQMSAREIFAALADQVRFGDRLRLLAYVAEVRVLTLIGLFAAVRKVLAESAVAATRVNDPLLTARLSFAQALFMYRNGRYAEAEAVLNTAAALSGQTVDRSLLGDVLEPPPQNLWVDSQ